MEFDERCNITYRTDAHTVATWISDIKIVIDNIERVNGVVLATKVEGDVEVLATWHDPPFVGGVIVGALDATVDLIGNLPWDLASRS